VLFITIQYDRGEESGALTVNPLLHDFLYNIICTEIMAVKDF